MSQNFERLGRVWVVVAKRLNDNALSRRAQVAHRPEFFSLLVRQTVVRHQHPDNRPRAARFPRVLFFLRGKAFASTRWLPSREIDSGTGCGHAGS